MKDKITNTIKKAVEFLKNNAVLSICCAVALVLIIVVVAVLVSSNDTKDKKDNIDVQWGSGITENIPEFDGECDSLNGEDGYCVAYYSEVTGQEVADYISKIETQCGVKFEGSEYPRSAVYGDNIIAIHYNVTEMKFSVTVVSKTANT